MLAHIAPIVCRVLREKVLRGQKWPWHVPYVPEISEPEQELVDSLARHTGLQWYQQVPFELGCATFYLDAGCLINKGRAIGIECDGRLHHQDKLLDCCRDALILGTGRLACIYRIDAWAVRKRKYDMLRLLGRMEPGLIPPDTLRAVEDVCVAHEGRLGLTMQERARGFIYRMVPGTTWVNDFLTFARQTQNQGIQFKELVRRFRK